MLVASFSAYSQFNIDKVKNIFGGKKETSKLQKHIDSLNSADLLNRISGSTAETKTAKYIADQFQQMLYKPYLGQYVHRFSINKQNNLSSDSYIKIYNHKLALGTELIIPPFSATGTGSAQALPGIQEADNLWFIKFTDVGTELNSKYGNGLEKMYLKAKEAIEKGAASVMFINNTGPTHDFTNTFVEQKMGLGKPVFILNHAAYKKYIVEGKRGKDWVNIDYNFANIRRKAEGHNAVGLWQNKTAVNVLVVARIDKLLNKGSNTSGLAVLLEVAEIINKSRFNNYNYILAALSGTGDEHKGAESLMKKFRLSKENISCVIEIEDIEGLDAKNELYLSGTGTSPDWDMVLGSFTNNFILNEIASGEIGDANHKYFYNKEIPVLSLFTKRNATTNTLNEVGITKVATSLGDMLMELDKLPKLVYTKTKPIPNLKKMDFKVTMGIIADHAYAGEGLLVGKVLPRGVAAYSNVMPGDVIVRMDTYDINSATDFVREMAKYEIGDRIMIQVLRNGTLKKMLLTFK